MYVHVSFVLHFHYHLNILRSFIESYFTFLSVLYPVPKDTFFFKISTVINFDNLNSPKHKDVVDTSMNVS